jgi:probable F420-dependent oxidoreductase
MKFGVTLKPDVTIERMLRLTRQAEGGGFGYGWLFDSHVLWKDPYPLLTLMAANTRGMRLGTCVTNPAVRDVTVTASLYATLNEISRGRMDLGIGRGDSSRRVMGKRPTTVAQLEETIRVFRDLTSGREAACDGTAVRLAWAEGRTPVWVAGYGPKVLEMAGRVADGIILQFADPHLIRWCLGFVRAGAKAAGRDPGAIEVMSAAAVWVSADKATGRDRVRWFPALVSNHVVDLIARYKPEELPAELTGYVRNRGGYDYQHHCEVDSSNADFVSDEVTDRFAIVGTAEEHRRKLEELGRAGVTQFNIYLMSGEEEATLDAYTRDVLPNFS